MEKLCFIILSIFTLCSVAPVAATARMLYVNDTGIPVTQVYKYACHPQRFKDLGLNIEHFTYCDKSLSYEVRAKDIIDRLSLEEKVEQLGNRASGVPRIGLPAYDWWSEALHGVSDVGTNTTFFNDNIPGATSFPTPITLAASFNKSLWKAVGQAVSTEARAMNNFGQSGKSFWSPNINVVRDPRWGRALETPGEDPFVVGTYASNYVRGLQDVEGTENTTDLNSRPLKVASCCKHYAAYDVDNWYGVVRETFDAEVREQDMIETFVRPFEMCVKDGDVSSVMCSYNRINGIPACADHRLLHDTIRGEWDLHGYIVSDCDSIDVMVNRHHFLNDAPEDAMAQVLKAGLDLDCGEYYTKYGANAVNQGKVREADIDKVLKNLYIVLFRLGHFDGSPQFEKLGKDDICSQSHIDLAIEAASEGVVLLKNDNNTLPLDAQKVKKVAVVGPHANATKVMIGNYAGIPCKYTTPLDAFRQAYGNDNVYYAPGCPDVACRDYSLVFPAVQASKKADAVIIVAGIDTSVEAESLDRENLLLPGYQYELIDQISRQSTTPIILVILSAGGVDISIAKNNSRVSAILWAGYPGEKGGQGIADVIHGKYNAAGRLPLTWFENDYVNQIPMTSMPLRPVKELNYPGRTYKFYSGSTVYPFGHGLSYTTFKHSVVTTTRSLSIKLNKFQFCRDLNYTDGAKAPACPGVLIDDINSDNLNIEFEVKVANVGERDSSESLLIYWVPPQAIVDAPIKQLVAFEKVFVPAGESVKAKFNLNAGKNLGLIDYKGYNILASGEHTIVIGENDASFPLHIEIEEYVFNQED
ncbi:probable beta-D-xylosidase 5 [Coffea arabica]|uniref:Probable beta-D-xylosidase 5 n=1 Tax=Coffea arabica TaxID=13443 RepID=A0A6P6UZD6_COFAR|nr:probable beta-D-xylosidase 5 [Coffea arabica]